MWLRPRCQSDSSNFIAPFLPSSIVPARHVLRIEALVAERNRGLAADVEAVDAERDNWIILG
jgi:hypothetical protein